MPARLSYSRAAQLAQQLAGPTVPECQLLPAPWGSFGHTAGGHRERQGVRGEPRNLGALAGERNPRGRAMAPEPACRGARDRGRGSFVPTGDSVGRWPGGSLRSDSEIKAGTSCLQGSGTRRSWAPREIRVSRESSCARRPSREPGDRVLSTPACARPEPGSSLVICTRSGEGKSSRESVWDRGALLHLSFYPSS